MTLKSLCESLSQSNPNYLENAVESTFTLSATLAESTLAVSVYTNNIDSFWPHFLRMITRCYQEVSDEHLQSYINEACFRWNTREASESERISDMFSNSIGLVKPNIGFKLRMYV